MTLSLLTALLTPAMAQEPLPDAPSGHIEALALTRVPDVLGAGVVYESPLRLRGGLSAGFIPAGYAGLVNDIARDLEAWDETTGYVVSQLLPGSITVRADVGWRPLADKAWFVAGGYQRVLLRGEVSPYEVTEALGDFDGLEDLSKADKAELKNNPDLYLPEILVGAGLHQVTFESGYQWESPERVLLRLSLGAAVTLNAKSDVNMDDIVYEDLTIDTDPYRSEASSQLDETLQRYFHTPTLGIAVGYRFR